jgi:acetoin utilization deacetylase AcuC-like enzyme
MATAYITHAECRKHDAGSYHPEAPGRLDAIEDRLIAGGLMDLLRHFDAPAVTREQLLRVHAADYLDRVEARAPHGLGRTQLDSDTVMNAHTLEAARRAAGAAVLATELVADGRVENAFCAIRPPGHHAEPDRAMGFCLFNNVAVAAAHALAHCGMERVAIVDFDVHHGNGTEAMFRDDPRVLFCSSFQHPFYPYGELDTGNSRMVHTPLKAGDSSQPFRRAIEQQWLPALDAFRPQMVFVSAGFDAHIEDDMSGIELYDADFGWVTERIVEVAQRHAEGRCVSVLEGGYALNALGRSVAVHLRVLMGIH